MTAPDKNTHKAQLRKAANVFAKKTIAKTFEKSTILDNSGNFPTFEKKELELGKVLGKGGFGTVYEIRGFEAGNKKSHSKAGSAAPRNFDPDESEVDIGEMESCKFLSDHCIRKGGDARYAVKFLNTEVIDDPATYIQAIMDMAVETRVLSNIEHPNIVKMRACALVEPYHEEYFIVMDRLYDTMEGRIEKWATRNKRNSSFIGKLLFDSKGEKAKNVLEQKLVSAFDLSAALDHLYSRNILYRDLKPENIGFDIRDDVKIFDFGLAKELHDHMKLEDGNYKLTGMTGSPRYMAPEVGLEKPYNSKCDVYSFGILFWQMYATKTPFELYGMKSLKSRVWEGEHKRPFIKESWPVPIKSLMRRAWAADPKERPSFMQISKILKNECVRVRNGDDSGLEHSRRRSTFVFRGARGQLASTTLTEAPTAVAVA